MSQRQQDETNLDVRAEESVAEAKRNARVLFSSSAVVVALACAYFSFTASVADPLHLYLGLVIMVMATLPALQWAKAGGQHLPMFEVYMLTTANTFALPLLSGHQSLRNYTPELVTSAAFTVLMFQGAALIAYFNLKVRAGRGPAYTREVLGSELNRYIGYGLWLTTIYTYFSVFTDVIPYDLLGPLRAVFAGIGLIAIFVQSRRWGLGNLAGHEKTTFSINLTIQVIFVFSTLFLVGGLSTLLIALLGYVSGSRRLPILPFVGLMFVLGLVHNGKSAMRAVYWDNLGEHTQPSLSELPGFFSDWITYGLTSTPGAEAEEKQTAKLLDRTSLFHLLCLVQSITPEKKPFMNGDTYANLPGQFVPRFFWPDKPLGHASTYQLAIYYGLQRAEDTVRTTIGFGMVIESYANFGLPGIIAFGLFIGSFYKFVLGRCGASPLMSYAGLYTVVLIAWSFQTEFPLSMWLSSMFQACVAIMGVPFIIRNFLG